MITEIKFRFWLGHTKKMTYEHSLIEISNAHWDFTEDIIPLQFTGRQDKNKKEIYNGDIVICHPENKYGRREIKIDLYKGFDNGDGGDFEIIGNIFENPELLNP